MNILKRENSIRMGDQFMETIKKGKFLFLLKHNLCFYLFIYFCLFVFCLPDAIPEKLHQKSTQTQKYFY